MRRMAITIKAITATVLAGALLSPFASAASGTDDAQVVLRRAGDRAVPFDPGPGPGSDRALRRDPAQAVAFVAPTSPQTSSGGSGLSSSDALIGAGLAALALAGLAALLLSRRPSVTSARDVVARQPQEEGDRGPRPGPGADGALLRHR